MLSPYKTNIGRRVAYLMSATVVLAAPAAERAVAAIRRLAPAAVSIIQDRNGSNAYLVTKIRLNLPARSCTSLLASRSWSMEPLGNIEEQACHGSAKHQSYYFKYHLDYLMVMKDIARLAVRKLAARSNCRL